MALDTLNIGAAPNDGTGDTIRAGGAKINSNFAKLATNGGFVYAAATDPAIDAAVSTAVVDGFAGTVITTTTTANDQTLAAPTDTTAGKVFWVLNSQSSTDPVNVNNQTVQVGDAMPFVWNGTSYNCNIEDTYVAALVSTGILDGVIVSGTILGTTFDLSDGTAVFMDDFTDQSKPTLKPFHYTGATNIAVTDLSEPITYVGMLSDGTIVQQPTTFTRKQSRSIATIAVLVHPTGVIIDFQEGRVPPMSQAINQVGDLNFALGPINVSGNVFSAGTTGLTLAKTAGEIHAWGLNRAVDPSNPSFPVLGALDGSPFTYVWKDGSGGYSTALSTDINPDAWDDGTGGVSEPNGVVGNTNWSIQRIYVSPGNQVAVHYGQAEYSNEASAVESIETEAFEASPQLFGALLRGFLIIRGNAVDWTNANRFEFFSAGKLGGLGAGAIGATTNSLQAGYNLNPLVITNANGAVTFREGNADDTLTVLEAQNNAGTATFSVTGEGNVNANNLSAPTISSPTGTNTVSGALTVTGDLVVNGTTITANTETVLIEDNLLVINNGEVGAGVTAGIAGIEVDRGPATTNYQFVLDEITDGFKIGEVGSLQMVATREDTPTDNGVMFFDTATSKMETSGNLTFDGTDLTVSGSVKGVTDAEFTQLANIDATTISATQWGYLGAMDQGVSTGDDVTFSTVTTTGDVIIQGDDLTIGTTSSPQTDLTITASTTGFSQLLFADTDVNIGLIGYDHNTDAMSFRTNDATRLTIDSSGNVGINTTDPSGFTDWSVGKFLNLGSANSTHNIIAVGATTNINAQVAGSFGWYNDANSNSTYNSTQSKNGALITGWVKTSDNNAGLDAGMELAFYTKPEAGVIAEALRIDHNGNVGIGTATPNYGGFTKAITLETTSVGGFELASTRADADAAQIGAFSFNYRTNSASHNLIGQVDCVTDGPTANQRGGSVRFLTKVDGSTSILEAMRLDSSQDVTFAGSAGFNGTAPVAKPTITGSRGGNAALADLLTDLAAMGLLTDSTT